MTLLVAPATCAAVSPPPDLRWSLVVPAAAVVVVLAAVWIAEASSHIVFILHDIDTTLDAVVLISWHLHLGAGALVCVYESRKIYFTILIS